MATWYRTTIIFLVVVVTTSAAEECRHCYPGSSCWPKMQDFLDFNHSIDGHVEFSNDAKYQIDSVMYNVRVTRFPYLIVLVANVDDVIKCVKFANKFNIKLTIRSSGHDYIGRSTADGSLQINLKEMKGLKFNLNSKRWSDGEVTAQSGNTWIRLYNEVCRFLLIHVLRFATVDLLCEVCRARLDCTYLQSNHALAFSAAQHTGKGKNALSVVPFFCPSVSPFVRPDLLLLIH